MFFNPNPNSGPIDSVTYEVYDATGPGGFPGSVVCTQSGLTSAGGPADPNLDLTLDGTCVLGEGTYWLSVLSVMPFVPAGQVAWDVNASANGSEFVWQDPSGLTGNPCVTWGLGITTCGIGAAAPDLCFGIDGTESVPTPTMPGIGLVFVLTALLGIGLFSMRRRAV